MKLYQHPMSTTCRPIIMFIADEGLDVEQQVVDILAGEQYGDAYKLVNPSCLVPALDDDDFRLIESSAILKYLAEKSGSKAYPKDIRARTRVNERLDWVNTNFYRSFGYGLVYTQILDPYKLTDAAAHKAQVLMGLSQAQRFLAVMNDHMLGNGATWLAGDDITIADYLASGIVSVGEVIGCTFKDYPNIANWLARMKVRPNWQAANGAIQQWAEFVKGPTYVTV